MLLPLLLNLESSGSTVDSNTFYITVTPNASGAGWHNDIRYEQSSLRQRARRLKYADDLLALFDAEAAYREILATGSTSQKKAAAKIIKPFAQSAASVPTSVTVDWQRVEGSVAKVEALREVLSRIREKETIARDDDEWFMLN